MKSASVGLLVCISILILGVVGYIAMRSPASQEKFVDSTKMQAVFLNGGQVYFGKITGISDDSMRVSDIYYLRVNQVVQPDGSAAKDNNQGVSLVKLGCELHGPQDSMVINKDQILFWENLKSDGKVAVAVDEFKKANPGGQKCDAPAADKSSTTPTTTPSTTKKP